MRELTSQLKRIKNLETRINPDREWILRNRTQLMTQIGHTSLQSVSHPAEAPKVAHSFSTWTKIFIPQKLVRSFKPATSVAFALLITTFGWIASAYAEPGDVLWGAKSAFNSVVENSRLVLAPESEQASLKLSYASKQAHILKQVVEATNLEGEKKAKLVEKTADSLEKKLDSAQESVKTVALVDSGDLVKEVSLSTQDISQTLKETLEKAEVGNISERIEKTAAETTKQSLEMVGDAVQKKTDANLEISNEEKEIVKDHIDQAVESIIAEAVKAQTKLTGQSTSTIGSIVAPLSTSTIFTTTSTTTVSSTIVDTFTTVKTLDEQKKTLDSLKETNLLEAINTTKALAEQMTTVIEQIHTQTTVTTPTAPTSTEAQSVSTSTSISNTTTIKTTTST